MNNFEKTLNETLSRYVEAEYSGDIPHEYAPENERKSEEITEKTKKTTSIPRRFPMKKRFAAALMCALVLLSSAVVYAASPAVREYINMLFLKEDSAARLTEVPEGYIGVYTAEDLDNVRENLNGKYILMNDIVLTPDYYMEGNLFDGGFVPIGDSGNPFTGIFNGNGYVISGLVVDGAYDYAGLFGYCRRFSDWSGKEEELQISGGIIKNLGLTDGIVNSTGDYYDLESTHLFNQSYTGGIAGYADYIVGCYTENFTVISQIENDISNIRYIAVGGVVGRAYYVDSCYSSADVVLHGTASEEAEEIYVSGVAGFSFSCVTSYFNGTVDSGIYPDYGVTYCQEYDVPLILTTSMMDEIIARIDAQAEPPTDPKKIKSLEKEGHSWDAMKLSAFYCSNVYFDYLDLPYQTYITSDEAGSGEYYLLDPETKGREYDELVRILSLAFPNNTFREFCIENHIKSGYYACYDLRDTPDCTFDGFDFDYIWYDRESPKLRLFKGRTNNASEILDRYSDYMNKTGQPVSDGYTAYEAYQNGWIKIDD